MLNCGAIFARTGPLNTRSTIELASKGTNIQRLVSTIARNKFLRSHLLEVPLQSLPKIQNRVNAGSVLASHVLIQSINSSCARALCLRKIRTHLLAQISSCTTDVRNKTDFQDISKSDFNSEEKSLEHNQSTRLNVQSLFDDVGDESHHQAHVRKEHELKYTEIEKLYPNARAKINDIFTSVGAQLEQQNLLKIEYQPVSKAKHQWSCIFKMSWPEQMKITATANNKPGAAKVASIKCLQWLHNQGKLKDGVPVVYDSKVVTDMLKKPTQIDINQDTLDHIKDLIDTYNSGISSLIENSSRNMSIRDISLSNETEINPVGRSYPESNSYDNLYRRNTALKKRLDNRPPSISQELPIAEYKEQIVSEIANNRALLIKGDTGCGKTTQVPQYIMDSFAIRGEATKCNMIISQPRRISAISLAERIADERKERIGDVVGYQVRLQQMLPQTPGGMLFCTTGVLLRKLQSNPLLNGCSHVILDEAHERSINTDMLMVLLKRALQKNPELKVVVMSATINADLFQTYFDCGVVEVPGRTYPVEMNFLEDIERLGITARKEYLGDSQIPEVPFVDCEQIGELISWIAQNKPPGAILCFLPGWAEIIKVKKFLEEYGRRHSRDLIVPVHSRMSHHDQRKIFECPPTGVRKIVLATDIAETGITVTDVVYVVDSATRKAMRWHEKKGLATMDTQYASQANLLQRKGRAGRVQSGTSYHMVSRAQFNNLDIHPLPEVLCSSLEKTVLDCKTYSSEKAESFLGSMPQPPTGSAVRKAINDLAELGALDDNENLTPLGRRIALFTVHPKLSKAMVYASIFQCVSPMVTVASAMSAENEIFAGTLLNKEAIRRVKQQYHPTSDHVSIVWIFEQWSLMNQEGRDSAKKFCWDAKLYPERMFTLSKVRNLNAEHLVQCHMLETLKDYDDPDGIYNEFSGLDEMVRGVLLSGLDQLLQHRDFDLRKGRVKKGTTVFIMEDGTRATITPESVNFKRKSFPSPFLTYVRRQHSEERRTSLIRETSMISPVTALLFSQSRIHGFQSDDTDAGDKQILLTIKGRKNFKLSCDPQVASLLLKLRDSMWNVVRYLVENHGLVENSEDTDHYKVEDFKRRMLQVLGQLLSEAAQKIDNPDAQVPALSKDENSND